MGHVSGNAALLKFSALLTHILLFSPLDVVYDTVTSPESGDGLNGAPYDVALKPFLRPGGRVVAINGSGGKWIKALLGLQVRTTPVCVDEVWAIEWEGAQVVRLNCQNDWRPSVGGLLTLVPP